MRRDTEPFELEDGFHMEGVRKTILPSEELKEEILPNTCWVSCRWDFELPFGGDKAEESLYLWMDVANCRLLGGYITEDTGYWEAGGWLESFRRTVEHYGIPKKIITDEDEIPENGAGKLLGRASNRLTRAAADFVLWLTWKESTRADVGEPGSRDLNEYVEEYLAEWNKKKGFFSDEKNREEVINWTAALERLRKKMEKDQEEGMRLLEGQQNGK